jgi:hypothetical protein
MLFQVLTTGELQITATEGGAYSLLQLPRRANGQPANAFQCRSD